MGSSALWMSSSSATFAAFARNSPGRQWQRLRPRTMQRNTALCGSAFGQFASAPSADRSVNTSRSHDVMLLCRNSCRLPRSKGSMTSYQTTCRALTSSRSVALYRWPCIWTPVCSRSLRPPDTICAGSMGGNMQAAAANGAGKGRRRCQQQVRCEPVGLASNLHPLVF
jgi:hypothetical protein